MQFWIVSAFLVDFGQEHALSLSLSLFPFGCIAGAFTTNYMMPLDRLTVSRTSSLLPYFGLCVYLGYMLRSLGEVTMKKKMY